MTHGWAWPFNVPIVSYDNFMLFQSVPVRTAFYSFSYHLTELSKSWISLLRKYFEVAKFLAVRSIERAQSEIAWKVTKITFGKEVWK